jgi:O-antigen/teichoic acid export membrane protein
MIVITPIKLLIIALFLVITVALFISGRAITQEKKRDDNSDAFRALSWRVGLSLLTFALLLVAMFMGAIKPNPTPGSESYPTQSQPQLPE